MKFKEKKIIEQLKIKLALIFKIIYMNPINFYFSLKIKRNYKKKAVKLSKPAYIIKILAKYYFKKTQLKKEHYY